MVCSTFAAADTLPRCSGRLGDGIDTGLGVHETGRGSIVLAGTVPTGMAVAPISTCQRVLGRSSGPEICWPTGKVNINGYGER